MSPIILILVAVLLAVFLYWQLVLAEGTYLGKRVVAWLYDLVADRYNRVKQYSDEYDAHYLATPLALSLQSEADPIVLDVATGTSRLPLALCHEANFHGHIIALDNARRMLQVATHYVAAYRDRVTWVWQDAVPLPFDDGTFDAVACLEAFEFMPDTREALAECIRVLKPGGILLVSNRVAIGAKLMPGKTFGKAKFESLLQALGQSDVTTQVWQVDYDLAWSLKPDQETSQVSGVQRQMALVDQNLRGLDVLRCPLDRSLLDRVDDALHCRACDRRYPIGSDGVIEMLKRW